jgi:crotonobetainyl-CoA:carnitine CoA-transferase CaiB-like acyl-CoA transferase
MQTMAGMAGVLDQLIWPEKSLVRHSVAQADMAAMELEAAKEILAEVFSVRISEVDDMILSRLEEAHVQEARSEENGLWPQEFRLEE